MTEDQPWVKIFSSSRVHEVEILCGLLKENDIQAITINKQDSSYLFGEAELYVTADDALRAQQIISQTNGE